MRERATQITPTPANEALCQWLTERYSDDEFATRIQVVQWLNSQRGEVIFTHDQKVDPSDAKAKSAKSKLTRERIVEISNRIVAASQADCDALRRSTVYAALAFHPAMGSDAYSRHLLRHSPKSALAVDADVVVNEDNVMSTRLLLGLLESERRDKRWMAELMANVVSGAAERDAARISALEGIQKESLERQAKFMRATEEALSMADERRLKREWQQVKIDGARDALRLAEILLPGVVAAVTDGRAGVSEGIRAFAATLTNEQNVRLFGKWADADTLVAPGILDREQAQLFDSIITGRVEPARLGDFVKSLRPDQFAAARQVLTQDQLAALMMVSNNFKNSTTAPVYLPRGGSETASASSAAPATMTAEQTIIGKFLHDCQAAGVEIKLFGDWQAVDGQPRIVTPGILTPDQVEVLLRVYKGRLPASALDDLMPTSGKPVAIMSEQQAQIIGIVPPAVQQLLMELIALRQQAAPSGGAV